MHTRSITFPDGTTATCPDAETAHSEWATIASSMTPEEIRATDEGRIDVSQGAIEALSAALAGMEVTFEALDLPEEVQPRPIRRARLDGTDVFVLTDAEHQVVGVTDESLARDDSPIFVGLGMRVEEGLTAEVADRIARLQEKIAGFRAGLEGATSEPDPRLSWRVVGWWKGESSATKLASRLGKGVTAVKVEPGEVVSVSAYPDADTTAPIYVDESAVEPPDLRTVVLQRGTTDTPAGSNR